MKFGLIELGQGHDHLVFGFADTGRILIPTTATGEVELEASQMVIKIHRPDKQNYHRTKEQQKKDRVAFRCLHKNFAFFNRTPPTVQRFIRANDWEDPVCPSNGVDVWERCDPVDIDDRLVMERLWDFGREICHLAVQYGLINDREFVSDFRPPNVMLRAGSKEVFVIVDA